MARQNAGLAAQWRSIEAQEGHIKKTFSSFFARIELVPAPASARAEPAPASAGGCPPVSREELNKIIQKAAATEGLTPDLLRAIIDKESAFDPCAISSKGALGLMQLMPSTAADLGVADAFDPDQNITGGARFLKQLLTRYGGDLPLALSAYNAGPGRVDKAGGIPLFPETLDYVSGILDRLRVPEPPWP